MKTIKLFQSDVYKRSTEAIVSNIDRNVAHNSISIVLDQTIFFPTGGGQSCDLGTINGIKVVDVFEKDDILYHILEGCDSTIQVGDKVSLEIDWKRRFDNMQRHCGEHILSGIFFKLFGGVNRGFHMGEDYMTIDISLEADERYTEIIGIWPCKQSLRQTKLYGKIHLSQSTALIPRQRPRKCLLGRL